MSKVLCIYHANCDDGFGAAYAVWKALGAANVEFHEGVYQERPPDVTGRDVVLVDFSYKRPVLDQMAATARSLLILDHHKTAEEDLRGIGIAPENWAEWQDILGENDPPHLRCAAWNLRCAAWFDMARSGAGLTWDFFHDATRPPLIDYIEDRDLWIKRLPGVDEFTAALRSYPQDFETWDRLNAPKLILEGESILRYYRTLVEQAKGHAYRRNIAGYNVPVVNASLFMASELAGELAAGEPFAAVYAESPDRIIYSLRSRAPDGVDVSEIAKRWGGGGHKHAAGFSLRRVVEIDLP